MGLSSTTFEYKSGAGFTLIEGIIAIGIISTALIVGLSLAYSNLTAAQANSDRIIAANLAREGLEAIRDVRDSNWLRRATNIDKSAAAGIQFYNWDDFLDTSGGVNNGTDVANFADIYLNPTFVPDSNGRVYTLAKITANTDLLACIAAKNDSCRIQKLGAVYFQAATPYPSAAYTVFNRRITLQPICWDGTNEYVEDTSNMICENSMTKIGVLATSRVIWQRGNKTLEEKAKERLYNWRSF